MQVVIWKHKGRDTVGKDNAGAVHAVERAIDILEAVSKSKPSMSVLEIQKAAGLSPPTLYRLLDTSARIAAGFSLDYAVVKLAQNSLLGLDPVATARPILERLHEEAKWIEARLIVADTWTADTGLERTLVALALDSRCETLLARSAIACARFAKRNKRRVLRGRVPCIERRHIEKCDNHSTFWRPITAFGAFAGQQASTNHPAAVKSCAIRGSGIMAKQRTDVGAKKAASTS
jgi:predicted transcriptional regulator